jgi:tetratricopeptide (TPR) repeat protein
MLKAFALLPLVVLYAEVGAQETSATATSTESALDSRAEASGAVAEADRLYRAHDTEAALEVLRAHLAIDSTDAGALWRAARAAVAVGIELEGSRVQNAFFDPAIVWARSAVGLQPADLTSHYWLAVASGRRAHNAGTSYAVELAQVAYDEAHLILNADSLHGGAHNILGKLNYEVMSLSRIKRFLARTFMGNDALDDMSWENAERHLTAAVQAWPGVVHFHHDLALLHRKRGRREEAIVEFRTVLSLPAIDPRDELLKEEARQQLYAWSANAQQSSVSDAPPKDR